MIKNKKGFTLVEIIVVVVILAVLMAVAVPAVLNYLDEADGAKFIAASRTIQQELTIEFDKAQAQGKDPQTIVDEMESKYSVRKDLKPLDYGSDYIPGYGIRNIVICFDGKNTWTGDPTNSPAWSLGSGDSHYVSKICVIFDSTTSNEIKGVSILPNKQIYYYKNSAEISNNIGTEEGMIIYV